MYTYIRHELCHARKSRPGTHAFSLVWPIRNTSQLKNSMFLFLFASFLCEIIFMRTSFAICCPVFRGFKGDVVYLSWPISPLVYEPKCLGEGRGVWVAGYQPMRTAVHITGHRAQINFGGLTPYLTYACIFLAILFFAFLIESHPRLLCSCPLFGYIFLIPPLLLNRRPWNNNK